LNSRLVEPHREARRAVPALAVVRGDNRPLRARRNLPRAASPRPALSASSDPPSRQGDALGGENSWREG
jgi:hypothetical protein